jgi:RNA polymerase sigma-70 factor (ECF subfamily)
VEENAPHVRTPHAWIITPERMSDPAGLLRQSLPAVLPRLRRFARTLARDPQDADDLAQDTIERALRNAAQWRPPSPDPTAEQLEVAARRWMFAIMKNAWIDNRRSHGRERELFAGGDSGSEVGDASAVALEEQLTLQRALARLPDEQRLAVALVLLEGLSYQEAADVMEVPIGTLTSRLARARMQLAKLLSPEEGTP